MKSSEKGTLPKIPGPGIHKSFDEPENSWNGSYPARTGILIPGSFSFDYPAPHFPGLEMRYRGCCERLTMPTPKLTHEIITAAILGFDEQRRRIDAQIAALRAMLSGGPAETAATPETPTIKRRKFSASARRHMKQAQQRRWAASKKAAEPSAPAKAPKPKRRISKAGMARIIAATKERWARVRAAKVQQEKVARKSARKKAAVKMRRRNGKTDRKTTKSPDTQSAAVVQRV